MAHASLRKSPLSILFVFVVVDLLGFSLIPIVLSILLTVMNLLSDIRRLLAQEAFESRVTGIAVWPFDTSISGKLAAWTTAILIGLITRAIAQALGV